MRTLFTFIMVASFSYTVAVAQLKEISVAPFSEITIAGPFRATLVKSNKCKVEIDYRTLDSDDVIIHSGANELEIKIDQGLFDFDKYDDRNRNRKYAVVTIYYTSVKEIDLKQGATLRATETLTAERLKLKSRMGSEMKLDLNVQELDLESSMGSEVDLTGTAVDFEISAKMGSDVDASKLKSQDVTVSASMGASVKVYAERELDASANFGASVTCSGNPKRKKTSGTFGSDFN